MSGAAPGFVSQRVRTLTLLVVLCSLTVCFAVGFAGAATSSATLIGDTNVEVNDDSNDAGSAEAFRATASTSGQVAALNVYLTSGSAASTLSAGIYADNGGHPGALLGQGSTSAHAGGWNTVTLGSVASVASGNVYWIAILGNGKLAFRDIKHGGASETSSQGSLTALPGSWSTGKTYSDGPVSAYGVGVTGPAADVQAPSAPTGLKATSATQTSVSLSWTASTDNIGVTGYGAYRDGASAGSSASTSYTVSGLVCGTSYTLAVDAYDAAGNRSAKTSVSGSTSACPTTTDKTAPSAPTGLKATSATQTSVSLSWTASTDNIGVTGYGAYRDGASAGSSASTSYTVSGLVCGTSYTLAVDAYDAAGNRSAKTSVSGSTSACPTTTDKTAPSAPTGLKATSATQTSVSLSWTASTDNIGVTGYGAYRDGASAGSSASTSYTVSGLVCGTSYTLAVDAYDAAGNRSAKTSVSGSTSACPTTTDKTAPSAPTGLKATSATQTSVSLSWTASTDNIGVTGYDIWVNGISTGAVYTPSATIASLLCATSYSFAVDAYDAAGNHSGKTTITGTTAACPPVAGGSAPLLGDTNVETTDDADSAGTAEAFLATASATGQTSMLKVYLTGFSTAATIAAGIYTDAGGRPGTLLGHGSGTATAGWNNAQLTAPVTLTNGARYWIAVLGPKGGGVLAFRDVRGGGASVTSMQNSLTTLPDTWSTDATYTDGYLSAYAVGIGGPAPAGVPTPADVLPPSAPLAVGVSSATTTTVSLSWPASSDNIGVAGYGVYRNGSSVGTATALSYPLAGLTCGTSYVFSVDAFDAAGNRSAKTSVTASTAPCSSDVVAPSVPSAVHAIAVSPSSVSLAWTASTDTVGVAGYTTYSNGVGAGTGAGTSYVVGGLNCGTSYAFAVDAFDAAGNHSARSTTLSASTSACAGTPAAAGTANVWVDPSGGSCARSAAPVGWSDATACGSFNAAYQACRPGDVILVQNGAYGNQSFTTNGSAGSPGCTLKPAGALGNVTVTSLNFSDTTWLTVQDLTSASSAHNSRANIDFDNAAKSPWDAHVSIVNGTYGGIFSRANYLLYKGLDLGDCDTGVCGAGEDGIKVSSAGCGPCSISTPGSHDVVFDGVYEHDVISNGVGHVDCMQAYGASRITVKNSMFYNCPEQAFIFTSLTGAWAPGCTSCEDGQVFENDYIAVFNGAGGAALAIGDNGTSDCHNCIVRNVTALTKNSGLDFDPATSIIENNIFQSINHTCNSAFSYNVYIGLGCGGTGAKTCTPTWTDSGHSHANADLATSDTCAKGAGNPGNYSPLDIYGTARASHLHNGAPDAGAYQLP